MQHHILVKWKERPADAAARLHEVEQVFQPCLDIPGVHEIKVIPNVIDRPNRYDLLIRITMEEAVLPVYDACDAHHRWKDEYGALIEKKAIFDCE